LKNMYQPPHFRGEDLGTQDALIRAHLLGLMVTSGAMREA
jgi:transcriptional regulator